MPDAAFDYSALQPLIEAGDYAGLSDALAEAHPADIADLLQTLEPDALAVTLQRLPTETAAAVLLELDEPFRRHVYVAVRETPARLAALIDEMEADDAADTLDAIEQELPELAAEVLSHLDPKLGADVRTLRQYPPESAGGRMQSEFFSIELHHTAREALRAIRKFGAQTDSQDLIYNVFVVDNAKRFVGTIDLFRLVLADPDAPLKDLVNREAPFVPAFLDQEEVAMLFRRYDELSMPVTDLDGRLVGRITVDDVLDVLEEEATEDMYLIAGLDEEVQLFDPPLRSVRKRLPWLVINMFTAMIAATIISFFEGTLNEFVVLAVFMPMIAGLGGNAGIQTLTITVRGLALGELEWRHARQILPKEILVGLLTGLFAGASLGVIAWLWKGSILLGVIILTAMMANLTVAVLAGSFVPLLLKRLKNDPALGSGILVTAICDAFGFFAFLGLASLMLRWMR